MRYRFLPLVFVIPAALAAVGATAASAGPQTGDFGANLTSVNKPGAEGSVALHQRGTHLDLHLTVTGLDGGIHVAHIHGIKQAENECPTLANDTNHDMFVDFAEGLPSYGPVQVTLSNGLNDTGPSLDYARSYTHLDGGDGIASLGDLDQYAIVVHGVDLGDGDDVATTGSADPAANEISMPAVCGVIVRR
jgi:hypothetical protein